MDYFDDAGMAGDSTPAPQKKKRQPKPLPIQWHHERRRMDELTPFQSNPRIKTEKGAKDLKKSIDEYGLATPITINVDGQICGGHQRYDDLQERGETHADCWVPDRPLTADEFRFLCIRLNKNIAGDWQNDLLVEFYQPDELQQLGFSKEELKEMGGVNMGTGGDDDAPEPEPEIIPNVAETGDIYEFRTEVGLHRIMCGSSTSEEDVRALYQGEVADMICTDPPYGVAYVGKTKDAMTIENDALEDYSEFFYDFLRVLPMAERNTAYLFMSGQELHMLRAAFEKAGFYWSDYLLWVKQQFVMGRKDYNAQHEFILYGWKGRHEFYGPTNACTLFDFDEDPASLSKEELVEMVSDLKNQASTIIRHNRPHTNDLHPTMKPVDLVVRLLRDGSQPGDVIAEPFLGSATTLIAAEKTGRRCYGMEMDPRFVDVDVKRFALWLQENGRSFTFTHVAGPSLATRPKVVEEFIEK